MVKREELVRIKIYKPLASCSSDTTYTGKISIKDLKMIVRIFKKFARGVKKEGAYFDEKYKYFEE